MCQGQGTPESGHPLKKEEEGKRELGGTLLKGWGLGGRQQLGWKIKLSQLKIYVQI